MVVEKVPGKTADSYTIDHTAGTYLFDTAGPHPAVRVAEPRSGAADGRHQGAAGREGLTPRGHKAKRTPKRPCLDRCPQADVVAKGSAGSGFAGPVAAEGAQFTRCGSSVLRIFFSAATSIWRMRSALTPYSAASSCSVMPPELSSLTFR